MTLTRHLHLVEGEPAKNTQPVRHPKVDYEPLTHNIKEQLEALGFTHHLLKEETTMPNDTTAQPEDRSNRSRNARPPRVEQQTPAVQVRPDKERETLYQKTITHVVLGSVAVIAVTTAVACVKAVFLSGPRSGVPGDAVK